MNVQTCESKSVKMMASKHLGYCSGSGHFRLDKVNIKENQMTNSAETKTKSAYSSRYMLLFAFYLAAHLPSFALFDARFWDDWSLYKASPETLLNIFWQSGSPLAGYLHLGMQSLGWWAYPCLTFSAFFLTVVCAYNILIKLNSGTYSAFWISLFIGVLPVNYARLAAIFLPSTLSLTVFMLSWLALLSLRGNFRFLFRLAALLGFFISFQIGSLLVFYIVPISTYFLLCWRSGGDKSFKYIGQIILGVVDFLILPFAYWYLRSLYFEPSGIFAGGYNAPTINISVFVKPLLPLLGFISDDRVAIGVGGLMVIAGGLLIFALRISKIFPQSVDKGMRYSFAFMVIGLGVSYIGVFPYAAVGKFPTLSDWTSTRHQLLLMFGLAILIFSLISICTKKYQANGYLNTLVLLFVAIVFIGNWWKVYSEFYVDHLKQRAIIALIKNHPELKRNNLIILDNSGLTAFNTKTGLGEYAALYGEATGLHDALYLDYDSVNSQSGWETFIKTYARFLGVWS